MSQVAKEKLRTHIRIAVLAAAGIGAAVAASCFISRPARGAGGGAVEQNPPAAPDAHVAAKVPQDAGRYLVLIGGCNDCHTPNYAMKNGQVPELDWLTGSPIGWYGPWGTTYASNLRLLVADMPEEAWVKMLRDRHDRPPMPWGAVNALSEQDSRAIYRYIKQLGRRGEKMPEGLAAGQVPKTPYLSMFPQLPAKQ